MVNRVTGEFGSEKVVLENAATEATLSSLLSAFEKMSKARGETPQDIKKKKEKLKEYTEAQKKGTEATEDLAKSANAASRALDGMFSGLGFLSGAISAVGGAFVGLTGAAAALTVGFMQSGDRLSQLIQTDFLFLADLADALDNNVDEFRNMAAVGATFGNSLLETRLTAANANLSLEQFSNLVRENSETLAIFGSTTQSGARRFANLSRQLIDGDVGQKLQGMGFTVETLNEGLANYIEIQARNNILEQRSSQELIEGTQNYLAEVDKLARVTGMERKEAQQAMLAGQEEAKFRNMRARLETDEARTRFDANLAFMEQLGPMGDVLKDLSDGAAQTREAQLAMSVLGPDLMSLAQRAGRADVNPEQLRNQLAAMADTGQSFVQRLSSSAFQSLPGEFQGFLNSLVSLNRLNNDAIALTDEEIANRSTITEALTTFQRTVRAVKETLLAGFLESRIFEDITNGLESFSSYFTTEQVTAFFNRLVDNLGWVNAWYERTKSAMSDFLADIEEKGLGPAIEEAISNLINTAQEILLGKEVDTDQEGGTIRQGGLVEAFMSSFNKFWQSDSVQSILQTMADTITETFSRAIQKLFDRDEGLVKQIGGATPFSGGGGTPAQMQEILNKLQNGIELTQTERAKAEVYLDEQARRQGMMSDNPFVREWSKFLQGGAFLLDPLEELGVQTFGRLYYNDEQLLNRLSESLDGRRTGSTRIEDFGRGTAMMLHGREAVLTEDQLFNLASGVYSIGARSSLANLDQRLDTENNTQSIQNLTTAIGEFKDALTADRTVSTTQTTNDMTQKLDQLNNTMSEVASILYHTHDISKRQLNTTRGMTGNMLRGAPV